MNLAARLEGLNKVYKTTAIIGSATADQLEHSFALRFLDTVLVKGRNQPERILKGWLDLSDSSRWPPDC